MTDAYDNGTEPHDPESVQGEHLTQGDVAHEYEFADEHGAAVDEHSEEHSPLPSEAKAPRRSALPIAAAVVGILALGAVAWWQFGGGPSSQPPSDVPSAFPAPQNATQNNIPAASASPALPTAPKSATATASVTEPVTADSSQALPVLSAAPSASALPAAAPPSPVTKPAETSQTAPTPLTVPVPAQVSSDADQRVQALSARMDNLQKTLDQLNTQLGQVTNMVAASAGPAATPKDVQDRLDKMEQQIASLHHAPTAPAVSMPPVSTGDTLVSEGSLKSFPTASHKSPSVHKAVVHKAKKAAPREAKVVAPHWILRAAMPGQAWVSTNSTSTDLKQISVGDTLPGIGRVIAIQHPGNDWIVQGTEGSVR